MLSFIKKLFGGGTSIDFAQLVKNGAQIIGLYVLVE